MQKKYFSSFLILSLIILTGWFFGLHGLFNSNSSGLSESSPDRIRGSMSPKADIEMKRGRDEWMNLILRDPATGNVPAGIRNLEISFARQLPSGSGVQFKGSDHQVTWKEGGPNTVGGRTRAMALDISDPTGNTIVAAGVSGGVWKSTNRGIDWEMKSELGQNMSVTSIVQDPVNTNVWYYSAGEIRGNSAGAREGSAFFFGEGIFKSVDNAETWVPLESTVNEDKIWNSEVNFTSRIVVNPQTGTLFLASNGFGIIRSDDGETFEFDENTSLGTPGGHRYTDIIVTTGGRLFAALSENDAGNSENESTKGIFYSDDDGITWTNITPSNFPNRHERTVLGASDINPDLLYAFTFTGSGQGANEDVRFFSIDLSTGISENYTSNLPEFGGNGSVITQFNYNMMLAVHPEDDQFVLLGATSLFRSTDGFSTPANNEDENWIGGYGKPGLPTIWPEQHPDQHIAVFSHSNPEVVWTGHDGGISVTQSIRAPEIEWEYRNDGYNTVQFYTIELPSTAGDNRVMGGTQDNGTPYFNHTVQMNQPSSNLSSGDGSHAHFGENFAFVSSQNGFIIRLDYSRIKERLSLPELSPDTLISPFDIGGFYWTYVHPRNLNSQLFIHPYEVDPNDDRVLFYPNGNEILRSTRIDEVGANVNPGSPIPPTIWQELPLLGMPLGYTITTLAMTTANPVERIYIGGSSNGSNENLPPLIHRVDNSHTSIQPEDVITIPEADDGAYMHDIAINPLNGDELIVSFSNYRVESLFHSNDAGETWQPIQGNLSGTDDLPGPSVRSAAILPIDETESLYFVGTSAGLFSTSNLDGPNTIWTRQAADQIGFAIADDIDVRISDGTIAAGTHGRGVFLGKVEGFASQPFITINQSSGKSGEEIDIISNGFEFSNNTSIFFGTNEAKIESQTGSTLTVEIPRVDRETANPQNNYPIILNSGTLSLSTNFIIDGSVNFKIDQNFPNPFNSTTTIRFDTQIESFVTLTIFDALGRKVFQPFLNDQLNSGSYNTSVDFSSLASGTYYARITARSQENDILFRETKPLTFVK